MNDCTRKQQRKKNKGNDLGLKLDVQKIFKVKSVCHGDQDNSLISIYKLVSFQGPKFTQGLMVW